MSGIMVARGQHHLYRCCIVVIYESKEVGKGSLMRVTVAYPKKKKKRWVEETVIESSRCGLLMMYSNCMVVRILTVLAVPGVQG